MFVDLEKPLYNTPAQKLPTQIPPPITQIPVMMQHQSVIAHIKDIVEETGLAISSAEFSEIADQSFSSKTEPISASDNNKESSKSGEPAGSGNLFRFTYHLA